MNIDSISQTKTGMGISFLADYQKDVPPAPPLTPIINMALPIVADVAFLLPTGSLMDSLVGLAASYAKAMAMGVSPAPPLPARCERSMGLP